jgi:uncharacterized protein HemY
MTSRAYRNYLECLEQLDEGRAQGTLDEEAEDALLEEMDDLWDQMSGKERDQLQEQTIRSSIDPSDDLFEDPC